MYCTSRPVIAHRSERQVFSINYNNIEGKYINKLAKNNGIKSRGRDKEVVIQELIQNGHQEKLNYLSWNFQHVGKYFTLCKTEQPFPDVSNTSKKFIQKLISGRHIREGNIGREWQPALNTNLQICAIKEDGGTIYLKMVEGKKTSIPGADGYSTVPSMYAKYNVVVIQFNNEDPIIELRCAPSEQEKYMNYVMGLMGFAKPYKWHNIPKVTKEIVSSLYGVLRAGVASRHISLPTGVGSIQINGKKGVNLDQDRTYELMIDAFTKLNIPTNDTMDETCYFTYNDPVSGLEYEAAICIDIKNSYFKFQDKVPDFVIKHVMEGIWAAIIEIERNGSAQAAAGSE